MQKTRFFQKKRDFMAREKTGKPRISRFSRKRVFVMALSLHIDCNHEL